jgi:hypothetical protein
MGEGEVSNGMFQVCALRGLGRLLSDGRKTVSKAIGKV